MAKKEITLYDLSRQEFDNIIEQLENDPKILTKKDESQRLLIHWAALHGCTRLVEYLLNVPEYQIDPEDDTKATPLILATLGGHLDIIKILLAKGANINAKKIGGHSALQYACSKEKQDIVEYLLENGAEINILDNIQDTPLHRLATKGNVDILAVLLKNSIKPNIDLQNSTGNTPLHIACEDDEVKFALTLIDAGASVELLNKDKQSPLDVSKPGLRRQIKTKLNIAD